MNFIRSCLRLISIPVQAMDGNYTKNISESNIKWKVNLLDDRVIFFCHNLKILGSWVCYRLYYLKNTFGLLLLFTAISNRDQSLPSRRRHQIRSNLKHCRPQIVYGKSKILFYSNKKLRRSRSIR